MGIEFDIDFARFEANPEWLQFLAKFGAAWQTEAQRLAQIRIESKTGEYNRGFRVKLEGGSPLKLVLGNVAEHAIYLEEDTQPHDIGPIVPKPLGRRSFTNPAKPGALRWFDPPGGGKGSAVFAARVEKVHHPGTKGKHIIKDAVTAAGDNL